MKAIISYFTGVKSELAQVEWPSIPEVIKLTIIVLIISAVVGLIIGGLDLGFTKLLEVII